MDLIRRLCSLPIVVAGLVAGVAVSGVIARGEARTQAALEGPVAIKFLLDFKIEGPAAPFLVGIDRGYYRSAGLDVTFDTASGSLDPINRVASGAYDMGFGDINTLIKFNDQNPETPVKAVMIVYNRPPFAIIARKSRGISKPKDLEGKTLGAPAGDGAFAQWKIFAQANDIDISKVTIDNVGFAVREPMLAAGQVDAITGYAFTSFIDLKDRGVPLDDIVVLRMADYGVELYGNAIIVNPKFAAEKPDAVRAFLHAFLKGLKETVRDPARAIDSVIMRNNLAQKPLELERLRMALKDNILTDETKANGFGAVDMSRLQRSIGQIVSANQLKSQPKASDIFDPSFLPAANERKVN